MSNSGGTWGEDGRLYITGHDEGVVFALALPTAGSVLELEETLPVTAEGQGIAWDRSTLGTLYSIIRSRREVVVSKEQPGRGWVGTGSQEVRGPAATPHPCALTEWIGRRSSKALAPPERRAVRRCLSWPSISAARVSSDAPASQRRRREK